MAAVTNRGIPLSSINPEYLHSNATSHNWSFGAIAELIDNAYDPDVSAKQLWIDKTVIKDQDCLIFMDNGNGMNYDKLHKMLSFGFSDKPTAKGHVPIGRYGNGFKSGSMRLGKNAIVFTKKDDTMCVGLLSQTYLKKIEAQNVIVPIVKFTNTEQTVRAAPEHAESLHDILTYSLFNTKEELLSEFRALDGVCTNSSGTRIIIWNLQRGSSGELEFDFKKDPHDIRILDEEYSRIREKNKRQTVVAMAVPEINYSLREYCSILYLKPRMEIILRGEKVESQPFTKTLGRSRDYTYKPDGSKEKITITFGYNKKSKEYYGLMMFHKNRLIKAYKPVACQRTGERRGEGVIGVIECNYLTPTHNKQDFYDTQEYRNTLKNINMKLEQYWLQYGYAYQGFNTNVDSNERNQKLQQKNQQQSPAEGIPVPSPNSHPHKNAGSRSAHIPTASPISARKKRALGSSRENGESKRARISHLFDSSTPGNPSTSTASPKFCSLPNIINPDVDQASSKDNETGATAGDDNILIIDHISSTRPKSTTGTFDITKVNLECMVSEEELARQMEHGESDTVVSMLDPLLSFRDVCIGTQTQQNPAVKQEEEDSKGRKKEKGGKDGESNHFESEKDLSSVEMNSSTHLNEETRPQQMSVPSIEEKNIERNNTESSKSEEELSHRETSNEITGDGQTSAKLENSVLNLLEAQQQQDQLLQFLEVATKERDESHDQLLLLSSDVDKLRSQLLELTQSMPKKEHSDHNKQTSPEEAQDYQVLYLQGKEEIKQLQEELRQLKMKKEERERKGQQALLEVDDELACQIDQGNKEREEPMNKVDSLESSKSALVTSCESLKKELEKMKRESEKIKPCAEDRGVQTDFPICSHEQSPATSAEASTSGSGTDFGPQHETHQILRDLRQKVARLLVTFVPDLDHQQVNYDCNVIDEILTDVVNDISPAKTAST